MQRHSRWQQCDLAETLLQAPALLAAIPTQDWSTLVACNRQLRHLIHSSVQAITVTTDSDIHALVQHSWPQLCLLHVEPVAHGAYKCLDRLPFNESVANLTAANAENPTGMATAFIVRPLEAHCQSTWYIEAAFTVLRRLWSQRITMLVMCVDDEPEAVLKYLNQGEWPCVHHFCLFTSSLNAAALEHMLKPVWPKLDHLGLTSSEVDSVALNALSSGGWAVLDSLDLTNSPLDASAFEIIPQVFRQCSSLDLSKVQLDNARPELLMAMRANLVDLHLSSTAVGATTIAQLFLLPWANLEYLDLSHNALASDGMASLIYADLPSLSHLDVSGNKLDVVAAQLLALGRWPRLWQLTLDNNQLDDAAMTALQHNKWPLMRKLSLSGNPISIEGVRTLTQCCWPLLSDMTLDSSVALKAVAMLSELKVCLHSRS